MTNLLSERGISLTSQEKSRVVDLDYDASRYVDRLSNENSDEDDDDESDDEDADEDDDDDESNEDSDENEDDSGESKASHSFDRLAARDEDGELSLDVETYRKRLRKLGRRYVCGSRDHAGFLDKDQRDIFCPNEKAYARRRLEEAAKL